MGIDGCKSYATEENLIKALTRLGFNENRRIIVRNRTGRWTAIFPASECRGNMSIFARHGFMTLG